MVKVGDTIANRFRLISVLGEGGMGQVFLAEDLSLDNFRLALKVLRPDLAQDREYSRRFMREVEFSLEISGPQIVRTYHAGQADKLMYFTMEYVPGTSLDRVMALRKVPLDEVFSILVQICLALTTIHSADVIHRDLKPENIILTPDGKLKVSDFGIARRSISDLTKKGRRLGTILYMAPELWQNQAISPLVDIYSLGAMVYELCTGSVPFDHNSPARVMRMHLTKQPQPPMEINPAVPRWLNALILQMLAKEPTDRPQSAAEILETLKTRQAAAVAAHTGSRA